MNAVFDANVVVKWFVVDPHTEAAMDARSVFGSPVAPSILPIEAANAFRRYVVAGDMKVDAARENLKVISRLVESVDAGPLLDEAVTLACRRNHSMQDCLYVTLAMRRGVPLVTADAKLVRKFADLAALDLRPLASLN